MIAGIDDLLRGQGIHAISQETVPWRTLVLLVAVCAALYGIAMGSFGGRTLQALYSACKVPLLIGGATLVCVPNFYVVNMLLGLRDDWHRACRGILAAQGTATIALVALSPCTLVLYASSDHYELCLVGNGLVFAIATGAGQVTSNRHYRPLIAGNPRHRIARATWVTLYVFVAIQMAWVLRPFLGAAGLPTQFFRDDAWTNAYVAVANVFARLFAGG